MASNRNKFSKKALCVYAIIVFIASATYFLKLPLPQYVTDMLKYYNEVSVVFTILICSLVPFRVYIFSRKRMSVKEQRFRVFGPLVSYISEPLYDVALFYSALFILHTVFEKGLPLDPLLVLLLVSALLLYESLIDLFKAAREIFYGQSLQNIATEQQRPA